MTDALTGQTVELLQQLIRNQCVNDGSVGSGQEVRTLHGVISSIERKHERPKANRPSKGRTGEPAE